MSQPDPAGVAPRGRRMASRLIVAVAIPTVLGLAVTGLRVADMTRSAVAYGQVARLAAVGQLGVAGQRRVRVGGAGLVVRLTGEEVKGGHRVAFLRVVVLVRAGSAAWAGLPPPAHAAVTIRSA